MSFLPEIPFPRNVGCTRISRCISRGINEHYHFSRYTLLPTDHDALTMKPELLEPNTDISRLSVCHGALCRKSAPHHSFTMSRTHNTVHLQHLFKYPQFTNFEHQTHIFSLSVEQKRQITPKAANIKFASKAPYHAAAKETWHRSTPTTSPFPPTAPSPSLFPLPHPPLPTPPSSPSKPPPHLPSSQAKQELRSQPQISWPSSLGSSSCSVAWRGSRGMRWSCCRGGKRRC